jgi:hypothetical protein
LGFLWRLVPIDTVIGKEFRDGNLQGNRQSLYIYKPDVASAPLNIGNVGPVDVCALGKSLLGQIKFVPPFSNGSSEPVLNIWRCLPFDARIKPKMPTISLHTIGDNSRSLM